MPKALPAQEQEYEFAKKQTFLQVRQAYFALQQQLERYGGKYKRVFKINA